ncbi:MAG TPA: hypothetical protein GX706_03580 [Candidatus Moranbacteria bacterium]|nr:hypothetical protein [Candidatus Moranbacteria bacterium]
MEHLTEKFIILADLIKKIKQPLLAVHPGPDTDTLGAAFALAAFFKDQGIKSTIFSQDQVTGGPVKLFPIQKLNSEFDLKNHDALFIIDRHDTFFQTGLDKAFNQLDQKIPLINIDHHLRSSLDDALNVVNTKAAATSEIIYHFLNHVNYPLSQTTAQYLLNGIYADTGGFRHTNTSAETLEISGELLRKGASIGKVNQALFAGKSLGALKLWGIALNRAQVNPKIKMAVSFITKKDLADCGASPGDISGLSEILNTISESNFSLILSEKSEGEIKASLRSEEFKKVDVSKIAKAFRGGGHKLASGFEIKGKLRQMGNQWVIE